ncbi:MAG TPA: hypothetical protein VJO33_15090 [Gemmatimonadaceae bacterium]|nr:hypothetical protein [Gemmatimonadaceae bacterium]
MARVTFSKPIECIYRFCRHCWPVVRDDEGGIVALIAAQREIEDPLRIGGMAYFVESRSGDDVAHYVGLVGISTDDEFLAEQAQQIRHLESDIEGPMPTLVADFVRKHYNPSKS